MSKTLCIRPLSRFCTNRNEKTDEILCPLLSLPSNGAGPMERIKQGSYSMSHDNESNKEKQKRRKREWYVFTKNKVYMMASLRW